MAATSPILCWTKRTRARCYVRPSDPTVNAGPWQISDGSFSPGFWVSSGKELYYMARDRSIMPAEVSTSPSFSFQKPRMVFSFANMFRFRTT